MKTNRRYLATTAFALLGIAGLTHCVHTPQDRYLYLLDSRTDRHRPVDLSSLQHSREYAFIVRVLDDDTTIYPQSRLAEIPALQKTATSDSAAMTAAQQWLRRLADPAQRRDIAARELLFINLDKPTTSGKKQLRLAMEQAVHGISRAALLRRTVPVSPAGAYTEPPDCMQLADDLIYASDNYFGLGLHLDDALAKLLQNCQPFE